MEISSIQNLVCPFCRVSSSPHFKGFKSDNKQGLFPKRDYTKAVKVYRCPDCELYFNSGVPQTSEEIFEKDDSLIEITKQNPDHLKKNVGYKDVLKFLKDEAGLLKGSKVLDMGSGTGMASYALRQAGYSVYAVEPKKELYNFSVENNFVDRDKAANLSFEKTEFEASTFDFIFLEPLHHFTDPHAAIQKALKWLKPGGYMNLEVVNSKWLYKKILALIYKLTFRKHVPYTSALRKPFNPCEYASKSFQIYAERNNLTLCVLKSYPCNTSIPNKFLSRLMSAYMTRFKQGMELSVILQKKI